MQKKNLAYLITGSNDGDRLSQLQQARILLCAMAGNIIRQSAVYETASWGKEDLPPHLNQCLLLETAFSAEELLKSIHEIEQQLGRQRQERWGMRTIDIDIIFFNHDVIQADHLKVPHPLLQERNFVLVPLAEIAPGYVHPLFKKKVQQLLRESKDTLDVRPFKEWSGS